MIVAVPFYPALTDYADLAAQLRRRGKLLSHSLVIISKPEDEQAAYEFGEILSDIFLRTHTAVIPDAPRNGNQLAADLFRTAVKFAATYVPNEGELPDPAMLYYDPNFRPLENGWLDKIQSSYYLNGAPLVFGRFTKDEPKLLVGPVVLGKGFHKATSLLPFTPANIHYRTYMQSEFLRNAVETFLIGGGSQESVLRLAKSKKPVA